jgi:transposase
MADSARILTLWALPDDLWQRIERMLNRFDPPRPRGRKRASARPILDGLIYHFRAGCQWNQIPEVYGDDSTIHRAFQRWVKIGLFEMIWSMLHFVASLFYFGIVSKPDKIVGCYKPFIGRAVTWIVRRVARSQRVGGGW